MPELPEVETIRRSLLPLLQGVSFREVKIYNPVVIESGNAAAFEELPGAVITDIKRRGKYLLFELEQQGEPLVMVAHMRMTGKLLFSPTVQPPAKHCHLSFEFEGGAYLAFEDTRRFGRFWLVRAAELDQVGGLNTLAPEPMDDDFTVEYWEQKIARKRKSVVKGALLDQHVVAGLGNIYADEVLFAAGVHPERRVGTLTHAENQALVQAMKDILTFAIDNRGTSFRDYVDGNNQKGEMQNFLQVFMKAGSPCPHCGAPIEKIKVVGRSSYYCPHCQKLTD